ncbi:class I SAM-dependent methyltransferase, partial [Enterobacter hormaechei]|uniref:class I SAM-dependent methyltransferase n=5 Tax=Pseudomonadota TaxID=1224 RepID=UPI0013D10C48
FRGAQIKGDYLEFGVYQGETFAYACNVIGRENPEMRFVALDSFEGLPQPKKGIDESGGYSGGFFEGQFSCNEAQFKENLKLRNVDLARVTT